MTRATILALLIACLSGCAPPPAPRQIRFEGDLPLSAKEHKGLLRSLHEAFPHSTIDSVVVHRVRPRRPEDGEIPASADVYFEPVRKDSTHYEFRRERVVQAVPGARILPGGARHGNWYVAPPGRHVTGTVMKRRFALDSGPVFAKIVEVTYDDADSFLRRLDRGAYTMADSVRGPKGLALPPLRAVDSLVLWESVYRVLFEWNGKLWQFEFETEGEELRMISRGRAVFL